MAHVKKLRSRVVDMTAQLPPFEAHVDVHANRKSSNHETAHCRTEIMKVKIERPRHHVR